MYKRKLIDSGLAAVASIGLVAGCAVAEPPKADAEQEKVAQAGAQKQEKKVDYTAMSPEEAAEHMIYEAKSFDIDQEVQEGGTMGERMRQDDIQKACSALKNKDVDADTAQRVIQLARESTKEPEGGIKLGEWKKGEKVAMSGFGFRSGHNPDDHSGQQPGGNCINCHELAPDSAIPNGTVGPSLKAYGKTRGNSPEALRYTYQMLYNPHATFPCTWMPRFGYHEYLTQEQISDVMAYLHDPESPVNKGVGSAPGGGGGDD